MSEPTSNGNFSMSGPPRSRHPWLITMQLPAPRPANGVLTELQHAKLVGTNLTACGLGARSWPRLWGRLFARVPGPPCPLCLELATRAQAALRRVTDVDRGLAMGALLRALGSRQKRDASSLETDSRPHHPPTHLERQAHATAGLVDRSVQDACGGPECRCRAGIPRRLNCEVCWACVPETLMYFHRAWHDDVAADIRSGGGYSQPHSDQVPRVSPRDIGLA